MVWKAIHKNPKHLQVYFKTLKDIAEQIELEISNEGINITAMDSSHISLLESFLDKDDFDTYQLNEDKFNIGISLNNLCKVLTLSEKIDTVSFSIKNKNANKLKVQFDNTSRKSCLSIPLLNLENDKFEIPSIDYQVEMIFSISRFIKACDSCTSVESKDITFKINHKKKSIGICAKGELADIEMYLKEDTTELKKRKISIKNKEGKIKEIKDVDVPKEFTVGPYVKSFQISYSLEHLRKILKIASIIKQVEVNVSEEMPIQIMLELFTSSYLNYYVAPKIDE